MTYRVVKTYGHERGLSACFRQHPATHSHCQFLHGYALAVTLEFEADELDERNWVIDFGGLKHIKGWIADQFDHKTLVAKDDPKISIFRELQVAGLIQLVELPAVGCEAFATHVANYVNHWLSGGEFTNNPRLVRVEVREHSGNAAQWQA